MNVCHVPPTSIPQLNFPCILRTLEDDPLPHTPCTPTPPPPAIVAAEGGGEERARVTEGRRGVYMIQGRRDLKSYVQGSELTCVSRGLRTKNKINEKKKVMSFV